MGTNASGTKNYRIVENPNGGWDVHVLDVKHADEPLFSVKVNYDDSGHIISIELPKLMQTNLTEFFEHHGIRGMKWGVRKRGGTTPSRKATRTVYGKHPKNLTSAELDRRIKRMEAEKKYNQLNSRDITKGHQLASEILTNSGRTVLTTVVTGALLLGVKSAVEKKLGPEVAKAIVKRGK